MQPNIKKRSRKETSRTDVDKNERKKRKNEMEEERKRSKRMVQAMIQQEKISSPSYSEASPLLTKINKRFQKHTGQTDSQKKERKERKEQRKVKKQLVEVTIERGKHSSLDYSKASPVFTVHVGSHLIETTASINDSSAGEWAHFMRRYVTQQGGSPIVGFCGFRLPEGHGSSKMRGPYRNRSHPSNPYQAIAICLGGFHVLFHILDTYYGGNNGRRIRHLKKLLNNPKVVVVGWGIKEMAKKIESQWGLKIARPVDIRKLAAAAYRKDALQLPKHKKGRVLIEDLELESLAEMTLDGMQVKKKPAHVLHADWSQVEFDNDNDKDDRENMEVLKYVARDAFLTYQIAAKCIERSELPPK